MFRTPHSESRQRPLDGPTELGAARVDHSNDETDPTSVNPAVCR
jgi:hypothetical protein